ncbi:hypothetical protein ACIBO5_58855 [Nonomuraea angiospora]|uniref:hypothetical protein n=1 Tax=Nonomuraea angiospora TaxID=46172 RepID=UPI0037AB8D55
MLGVVGECWFLLAGCGRLRVMLVAVVEEFLEQDEVVDHGLPQVLGGGLARSDAFV